MRTGEGLVFPPTSVRPLPPPGLPADPACAARETMSASDTPPVLLSLAAAASASFTLTPPLALALAVAEEGTAGGLAGREEAKDRADRELPASMPAL